MLPHCLPIIHCNACLSELCGHVQSRVDLHCSHFPVTLDVSIRGGAAYPIIIHTARPLCVGVESTSGQNMYSMCVGPLNGCAANNTSK